MRRGGWSGGGRGGGAPTFTPPHNKNSSNNNDNTPPRINMEKHGAGKRIGKAGGPAAPFPVPAFPRPPICWLWVGWGGGKRAGQWCAGVWGLLLL